MRHTHEVIGNLRELRLAMETVDGKDQEARKQIEAALAVGIRDARTFRPAGEIALQTAPDATRSIRIPNASELL